MTSQDKYVTSYVAHHWAASKGGLDLFRRSAQAQSRHEVRVLLHDLATDVGEDRDRLRAIADRVGAGQARIGQLTLSIGEKVSRVKLNGRLARRSPLSDVLEVEALITAVRGKRAGWEGLLVLAESDPRLEAGEVKDLIERADDQLKRLSHAHTLVIRELSSNA